VPVEDHGLVVGPCASHTHATKWLSQTVSTVSNVVALGVLVPLAETCLGSTLVREYGGVGRERARRLVSR
jgi:hypothetical protein